MRALQDNLNQNFENSLLVERFSDGGKAIEASLNEKYHDGEFTDPKLFDPEEEHKVTWATVPNSFFEKPYK